MPLNLNQARVIGGKLTLRKTPNSTGNPIAGIPDGSIVTILNSIDGWRSVKYVDGKNIIHKGWAKAEYLTQG